MQIMLGLMVSIRKSNNIKTQKNAHVRDHRMFLFNILFLLFGLYINITKIIYLYKQKTYK